MALARVVGRMVVVPCGDASDSPRESAPPAVHKVVAAAPMGMEVHKAWGKKAALCVNQFIERKLIPRDDQDFAVFQV